MHNRAAAALSALLTGRDLPPGPVPWEEALRLAREHGVSAACAVPGERPGVPASFLEECRRDVQRTTLHNRILLQEAERVSLTLQQAGVEHLVLKGIVLLASGAADTGTRPTSDIDLLVRPESAEDAMGALHGAGFAPTVPDVRRVLSERSEAPWVSTGAWPPGLAPQLDLHVALPYARIHPTVERGAAMESWLWNGPRAVIGALPAPAAAEHLVLLVLHAAMHLPLEFRGKWLLDLAHLASAEDMAWEEVARLLETSGARGVGWLLLGEARGALGAPVPEPFLAGLRPGAAARASPRVVSLERLLALGRAFPSVATGRLWRAAVDDEPASQLRGAVRAWVPTGEWLRARYPDEPEASLARLRVRHMKSGMRMLGGGERTGREGGKPEH